jgi:hypothetical protein
MGVCLNCHGDEPGAAGLVFTGIADELILPGSDPNPSCTAFQSTTAYVVPGNPQASFLWAKLNPGTPPLPAGCGGKMPPGSGGNQVLADLVAQWITEGANP